MKGGTPLSHQKRLGRADAAKHSPLTGVGGGEIARVVNFSLTRRLNTPHFINTMICHLECPVFEFYGFTLSNTRTTNKGDTEPNKRIKRVYGL